jgi:hypothetical protein
VTALIRAVAHTTWRRSRSDLLEWILWVSVAFLGSGCAPISPSAKYLFSPVVDISGIAQIETNGQHVSVEDATSIARKVEEQYVMARVEYGSLLFATASSRRRRQIYAIGSEALECLVSTRQPFDPTITNLDVLDKYMSRLDLNLKVAATDNISLEESSTSPLIAPAEFYNDAACGIFCFVEKTVVAIDNAITLATDALRKAIKYRKVSVPFAGISTLDEIYAINNRVSVALIDDNLSLDSLRSEQYSGIADSTRQLSDNTKGIALLSTALESAAETPMIAIAIPSALRGSGPGVRSPGTSSVHSLETLYNKAQQSLPHLSSLVSDSETIMDLVPSGALMGSPECKTLYQGVHAPTAVLSVEPSGDISVPVGGNKILWVSGGSPPYIGRFQTDAHRGGPTARERSYEGGGTIEIQASSDVRPNQSFVLVVEDSSGNQRLSNILTTNSVEKHCHCDKTSKTKGKP